MFCWLRKLLGPLPAPIFQIDERRIVIASPGDLVILTLPEELRGPSRESLHALLSKLKARHGVSFYAIDLGAAVTVVKSMQQ